jgi:NADH dehydrogenase
LNVAAPRIVIIGGGFGGLTAAQELAGAPVEIILIDRTNHHLFQPLLYQVATAALSPGDIASPLRVVLRSQRNARVILGDVLAVDRDHRQVVLADDRIAFDYLVAAPGSRHSYFGHPEWESFAPGLKTVADAVQIRERLLLSFEEAERVQSRPGGKIHLTFAIVGGGPTGVELAGAISEIACKTILPDFPSLHPHDLSFLLLEGGDRILAGFHPALSQRAETILKDLGVDILLNTKVTDVQEGGVVAGGQLIQTASVIWAAGNEASPLLASLKVPLDRQGRVIVERDLTVPGEPMIFVIGDAASAVWQDNQPLPALAPVAMQQARYVARVIRQAIPHSRRPTFLYKDRGKMATVGKARAIVELKRFRFAGILAWLLWAVVHIFFLIGFRNRFRVMSEWIWYYVTYQPGARLIFGITSGKKDSS